MDYHYYRGDEPKIPPKLRRYMHLLRPVGVVLMVTGIVIPMLILVKVLGSTYFVNFLSFGLMLLGPALYLVGMVFDNFVDRAQ